MRSWVVVRVRSAKAPTGKSYKEKKKGIVLKQQTNVFVIVWPTDVCVRVEVDQTDFEEWSADGERAEAVVVEASWLEGHGEGGRRDGDSIDVALKFRTACA